MSSIVVVFTQSINQSTSSMIRSRNIVNELAACGNRVVCFSPFPKTDSIYFDQSANIHEGIDVKYYGKKPSASAIHCNKKTIKQRLFNTLRGVYSKFDLFGSSIQYMKYRKQISAEISVDSFDVLLSFSDPKSAHIVANYCKKRNPQLFYVQQWGDPLTQDITNKSWAPKWIKRRIEKGLLSPADKVCYVSPLTSEIQKMMFSTMKSKIYFTPTPCEVKEYKCTASDRLSIGYMGSYNSVARNIIPLYEAACECDDFDFYFVGDSDVVLQEKDNIHVIGRVNQKELESYAEVVDILVCLMNVRGSQIPGKLYNYAGTNKEILVLVDGERGSEIRDFFSQYDRYTFVDNEKNIITSQLNEYHRNGIPYRMPVEEFLPDKVAQQLVCKK